MDGQDTKEGHRVWASGNQPLTTSSCRALFDKTVGEVLANPSGTPARNVKIPLRLPKQASLSASIRPSPAQPSTSTARQPPLVRHVSPAARTKPTPIREASQSLPMAIIALPIRPAQPPGAVVAHPRFTPGDHEALMVYALAQACKCPPTSDRFRVGAVLVDADRGEVLATGHALEHPRDWHVEPSVAHAEQSCLADVAAAHRLPEERLVEVLPANTALYTTVEPCNGRFPPEEGCVHRILRLRKAIKTVYVGIREPGTFVSCLNGQDRLEAKGVKVVYPVEHLQSNIYQVFQRVSIRNISIRHNVHSHSPKRRRRMSSHELDYPVPSLFGKVTPRLPGQLESKDARSDRQECMTSFQYYIYCVPSPHNDRLHHAPAPHDAHGPLKVLVREELDQLLDREHALAPPPHQLRYGLLREGVALHGAKVLLGADHEALHVDRDVRLGQPRADLDDPAAVARGRDQRHDERRMGARVDGDGRAEALGGVPDAGRDLVHGQAGRVDRVRRAEGPRQLQAGLDAVDADDGPAAAVPRRHDGRQAHAAHAHDGEAVVGAGVGHLGHGAAARLQAAPQRRQQPEVVARQAQPRHVDDRLGADDRVARQARLAEEAAADAAREDVALAQEVDGEEVDAVRPQAPPAHVAAAAQEQHRVEKKKKKKKKKNKEKTGTFVPQDPGVEDAGNSRVGGRVAAVKIGVADARRHHLDQDLVFAQLPQRDGLNGPFALGQRASGHEGLRLEAHARFVGRQRLLGRGIVDDGALCRRVRMVRVDAVLAAHAARRLGAAPGAARVVAVVRVDPDDARLDLLGDAEAPGQVARPDARPEPELAVVGQRHGLRLRVEAGHDDHGAEGFGPPDGRLRDAVAGRRHEHRRLVEVAPRQVGAVEGAGPLHAPPAGEGPCELALDRLVDQALDLPQLLGRDERAHHAVRVGRAPDAPGDGFHLGLKLGQDLVEDGVLDNDPRARDARLAAGDEAPKGNAVDGHVDVGVLKDNQRCLAAQLGRVLGQVPPDDGADGPPRGRSPRHVDLPHQGVLDELPAGGGAVARQDGEDAVGDAGAAQDVAQQQGGQGGQLAGLDDDAVAGGQGGGQLLDGDEQRVVEGGDVRDDAQRHAVEEVVQLARRRQHRPLLDAQQRRVVPEPPHQRRHLRLQLAHRPPRLPHLERDELRQRRREQRRAPLEHLGPRVPRRPRPDARLVGVVGRGHGRVDVV
ncbi:hypothetical protein S7711_08362 [Stachybotrys chartarum IBT 7711]|uniref:CMP/dCMP-type deaminase domain-containing protein n=1 Tax=Stachybotrys chartarum (strain CBS 109288 / IBT 7711) TaxID=1280523 RepID=A0A084AT81_STACB|nr:hypothetical protein S7711_08362 [Stachybotrys chartarum IBT 7711]